jgi:hypothetical protein
VNAERRSVGRVVTDAIRPLTLALSPRLICRILDLDTRDGVGYYQVTELV